MSIASYLSRYSDLFIFRIVFVQVRQLDTAHGHAQEAIARVSLNADVTQCMDGVTVSCIPQHADLVYCYLGLHSNPLFCAYRALWRTKNMRLLLISWTPSQSFIILCLTKKTSPRQTVKMRNLFEFETLLPELSGKSCILQHPRVTCRRFVCGSLLSSATSFLAGSPRNSLCENHFQTSQVLRFAKLFPKLCLSDEGLTTVCLQLRKVRRNSVSLLAFVFFMLTDFPRSLPTACHCTFQTR